jgi:hypothetical protein
MNYVLLLLAGAFMAFIVLPEAKEEIDSWYN